MEYKCVKGGKVYFVPYLTKRSVCAQLVSGQGGIAKNTQLMGMVDSREILREEGERTSEAIPNGTQLPDQGGPSHITQSFKIISGLIH